MSHHARIVILMGVAGSGKTTIGQLLAMVYLVLIIVFILMLMSVVNRWMRRTSQGGIG